MISRRNINPWYVIIWRALWWPLYLVAILVATTVLFATLGKDRAISFWKYNV